MVPTLLLFKDKHLLQVGIKVTRNTVYYKLNSNLFGKSKSFWFQTPLDYLKKDKSSSPLDSF